MPENQVTSAPKPIDLITSIQQDPKMRALVESAAVLLSKADKYQLIPSDADAEVVSEFRARLTGCIKDLDTKRLEATEPHRALVKKLNDEANDPIDKMKAVLTKVDTLIVAYAEKKKAEAAAAEKARQEEEARIAKEAADAETAAEAARQAAADAAVNALSIAAALEVAVNPEVRTSLEKQLEDAKASQQEAMQTASQQTATLVQLEERAEVLSNSVISANEVKTIRGSHGSTTTLKDNWVWELIDTKEQPAAESIKLVPPEYLVEPAERLAKTVLNAKAKVVKKESTTAVPGIRFYNKPAPSSRTGR